MLNRIYKFVAVVLVIAAATFIASSPVVLRAAVQLINLTNATQITGLLPCGHGGIGTATASANTVFAGPTSGAAACPAFRALVPVDNTPMVRPNTRRWSYHDQTSNNRDEMMGDALVRTGSIGISGSPANGISINTGTVLNAFSAINGVVGYDVGRNNEMLWTGGISTVHTSIRSWICMSDQTVTTMSGSATPAGSWACFRFDTSAGDTHWQCGTSNAGTSSFTDTGLTPDTATNHKFKITFNDATPNVVCTIDGANTATNTTNLPASGTILQWMGTITTLNTTAKSLQEWSMYLESDF